MSSSCFKESERFARSVRYIQVECECLELCSLHSSRPRRELCFKESESVARSVRSVQVECERLELCSLYTSRE